MKSVKSKLILAIAMFAFGFVFFSHNAQAATNGRLIDDAVFDNSGTMSAADIQTFLNQFPSSCLKSYQAPYPNSYFSYGANVSAATVIRRVADLWGVNPRVILTKLQQEQSLVTGGSGCSAQRYSGAMGFNCPEGTACPTNPANAGFSQQTTKGMWVLKFRKERANGNLNWLISNNVPCSDAANSGDNCYQYAGPQFTRGNRRACNDPGNSSACPTFFSDGIWNGVLMETGATASLYNYTPHMPSSFDNIYEGWWGSTLADICSETSNLPAGMKSPADITVFASGTSGEMECRAYNGGWQPFSNLSGMITDSPSVVSISPGAYDLFVRGGAGTLYHRRFAGTWQAWENLGGSLATGPSAVSMQAGVIDIFAQSTGNKLIHMRYDHGWTPWEDLGGTLTHAPGTVSISRGIIDIFSRGTSGELNHMRFDRGWHPWENLGGTIKSEPAAATMGGGTIDIFAQSTGNSLMHRRFAGGWTQWEDLGGDIADAPAAVSVSPGVLDVFNQGSTNRLGHRRFSGGWLGWEDLGGSLKGAPAAIK